MKMTLNIRIRYIVLFIILAIPFILVDIYVRLGPFEMGYDKSHAIIHPISVALGMQRGEYPLIEAEKKLAILHLSDEEWNKISCKLSIDPAEKDFIKDCGYDEVNYVPGKMHNGNTCPNLYLPLKECIEISAVTVFHIGPGIFNHTPDLAKDYCGHWGRSNCFALEMSEYALTRPDIFNVIIEAATHPCKFIPSKEQYCEDNKDCTNYDHTDYAKLYKKLSCENRKNAFQETVIINVFDQNRQSKFHIKTKRKE